MSSTAPSPLVRGVDFVGPLPAGKGFEPASLVKTGSG